MESSPRWSWRVKYWGDSPLVHTSKAVWVGTMLQGKRCRFSVGSEVGRVSPQGLVLYKFQHALLVCDNFLTDLRHWVSFRPDLPAKKRDSSMGVQERKITQQVVPLHCNTYSTSHFSFSTAPRWQRLPLCKLQSSPCSGMSLLEGL